MLFFCASVRRQNPYQSILYKLAYGEEQPRKSVISNVTVKGNIRWVNVLPDVNGGAQMFVNISEGANSQAVRIVNEAIWQNVGPVEPSSCQIFYQSQNNINEIHKCKDSSLFLASDKQILCIDPNKMSEPQSLIESTQAIISHTAVDPARGYLTYCIKNTISIFDKQSKRYIQGYGSQKYTFKVSPKQSDTITNIHYNPNKQYYLMSGHHDFIKFWDVRKGNIPVKIVSDHHSLLLKSVYNHAHDQLILGAYDDGSVGLFRMPSVSSSPSGEGSDTLVKLYDEHEDSVYQVCWSHSPWIFGSVSHNSTNFVVSIVPSVQKYRILL